MTEILTPTGKKILWIEVPLESTDISQTGAYIIQWRMPHSSHKEVFDYNNIKLLGVIENGEVKFDCSELIERDLKVLAYGEWYKCYTNKHDACPNPSDSFLSFLTSKQIPTNGKIVVVEVK